MRRNGKIIKILFVCHGNICRSPMAEFIMKDIVRREHLEDYVMISSAATSTEEIWGSVGNPIYPQAMDMLNAHGIGVKGNELGCKNKRAQILTKADYDKYDMLIGMEQVNLRNMKRICGNDPLGKMSLLMDYTDRPGDVSDPWYTRRFDIAWRDIEEGCRGLLEYLYKKKRISPKDAGGDRL